MHDDTLRQIKRIRLELLLHFVFMLALAGFLMHLYRLGIEQAHMANEDRKILYELERRAGFPKGQGGR